MKVLLKELITKHPVDLEYKTQEGGELCSCQIFANQAVWLILLPDLETVVGKYAENNEHKNFYVENLVPNQGKKPRPTIRRIFTLHYHGQNRLQRNSPSYT